MTYNLDTIVAISTPPGYSGISVIRVSGSNSLDLAKKHFRLKNNVSLAEIEHRKVYLGYFVDSQGSPIDECLLIYMRSPKSYTGEDVVEFHCHGGSIIPARVVEEILKNEGLVRYAEPGEFTYRAFLNGKKDLTQAEAVESLIHSKTYFQQKNALKQLDGYLGTKLRDYFNIFEETRLALEAIINFPEDVENVLINIEPTLNEFSLFLDELISSYNESQPYISGVSAIIIGKPNVGKSSFMNLLLNNERVIVSPFPGTTRDLIEETIVLEGIPLKIIDTAGIRFTNDPIESIGIEKTKSKLDSAQIVFAIFDVSDKLTEEDREIIKILRNKKNVFVILNKIDKGENIDVVRELMEFKCIKMSIKTGNGFEEFKKIFRESILEIYSFSVDKEFYVTSPRHNQIFLEMKQIVSEIVKRKAQTEEFLFALNDLISLYDRLLGRNASEEEINKIFSRFCIGK
ncbi:MAG: tRNA uridine-5-carboxymethylaminomethyl(34) synthesis GTPase MnmE [Proteobacteria bacterium]|nr:tRNA uridine-5-carboxymethylaminomethyl(34) synthesis GTPase MnmE [Pseudomonadota bacterium]